MPDLVSPDSVSPNSAPRESDDLHAPHSHDAANRPPELAPGAGSAGRTARPKRRALGWVALVAVALGGLGVGGYLVTRPESQPTPERFAVGDGIYDVGIDIMPGTYRVGLSGDTDDGFVARYFVHRGPKYADGFGDEAIDIVDSGYSNSGPIVMIVPDDPELHVEIVGGATPIESAPPVDPTQYTQGTFLVGYDLEPGEYMVTGEEKAWARYESEMWMLDMDYSREPGSLTFTVLPSDFAVGFTGTLTKID